MSNSLLDAFTELERDLAAGVFSGYLPRPIPHDLDARMKTLIDWFLGSDEPEQSLLSCLPPRASSVLLAFAERRATLAVRTRSSAALSASVVAIGLAAAVSDDERECMLVMPLPWRAAAILGAHQSHLFTSNATKVPQAGTRALLAFVGRTPEDQTLESMGYTEGRDSDGFRFERTW